MTVTSTNRTDLSYIAEVTPGLTPATPAWQILPTTGGAPSGNLSTEVSAVIRSDRATDDLIVVDSDVMGDGINYELSYAPFTPLLQALLQSSAADATVAVSAASDISVTDTDTFTTSTTNPVTENIKPGQIIRVAGNFSNSNNNGYFLVSAVTSTTIVTADNRLSAEGAAASTDIDCVSWVNGADTPTSYSWCKRVQGITTPAYFYYRGMQVSQFVFNFQLGQIISGSFGLKGLTEDPTTSAIAGQTFTAIPAYTVMSPATSVPLATITSASLTAAPKFEQLDLTINNNIEAAKQIGTLGAADLASFTLEATGDVRIYFEDVEQYNLFRNSSEFSVALVSEDSAGNAIGISMPRCKFRELEPPIDGKDNFLMLNGSFTALYDTAAGAQVLMSFIAA